MIDLLSKQTENWIQSYSGKVLDILDPQPEQIDIYDIAHALSLLCRFGGHCTKFYSVAEHSVRCSWKAPKGFELEALLHDASEAYFIDIPRPIKILLPEYKAMETRLEKVIAKKYNLPFPMSPEVKDVDNRMLSTEQNQIMKESERPWTFVFEDYPDEKIDGWPPETAYNMFIGEFRQLTRSLAT